MPVLVAGLSHHTAPVELRERFAFAEADIPDALDQLRATGRFKESVIVSTCNRVELYAASPQIDSLSVQALRAFLVEHGRPGGPVGTEVYTQLEPHSIEHLFRVVSGLDSMVLGETEILGQVKKAYDLALRHHHTGPVLNRVFQRAFNVAKQIRTHTQIQRGSVSVASVAVDLAEKIFDTLAERTVLVLGAGDTSEKAAKALLSRGAKHLLVSNRTGERAEALAAALGGRAVPFDRWTDEAETVDVLVTSTAATEFILDRARLEPLMKRRRFRPLLLVDIAVPRNIDPAVNYLDSVYLYDVDDLQTIADDSMRQRRGDVAHCEQIIRERASALLTNSERKFLDEQTRTPAGSR
jgi:glutamyl-tRNA reductase